MTAFTATLKDHPAIILSLDIPQRVLSINTEFVGFSGFKEQELKRSFKILTGPKSDMKAFKELLVECSDGITKEHDFHFYKKRW